MLGEIEVGRGRLDAAVARYEEAARLLETAAAASGLRRPVASSADLFRAAATGGGPGLGTASPGALGFGCARDGLPPLEK